MKNYENIKPVFEIKADEENIIGVIGHEHIGIIKKNKSNGWNKEVNIVAWNGGKPKFDIREWDKRHERMTRGLTLTEEEARILSELLNEYFNRG